MGLTCPIWQVRIPDDLSKLQPIPTQRTKSGWVGVYPARKGRWQAQVNHRSIGGYPTAWEAGVAVAAHLVVMARAEEQQEAARARGDAAGVAAAGAVLMLPAMDVTGGGGEAAAASGGGAEDGDAQPTVIAAASVAALDEAAVAGAAAGDGGAVVVAVAEAPAVEMEAGGEGGLVGSAAAADEDAVALELLNKSLCNDGPGALGTGTLAAAADESASRKRKAADE